MKLIPGGIFLLKETDRFVGLDKTRGSGTAFVAENKFHSSSKSKNTSWIREKSGGEVGRRQTRTGKCSTAVKNAIFVVASPTGLRSRHLTAVTVALTSPDVFQRIVSVGSGEYWWIQA